MLGKLRYARLEWLNPDQVRKKKLRGVQWYRRKFRIDYHRLYLHYLPGDNPLTKRIYKNAPKKMFRWVNGFGGKGKIYFELNIFS